MRRTGILGNSPAVGAGCGPAQRNNLRCVGTNFKLDVGKDGNVSGTIEKKQAYQAINRGPG
jgi:hypothetical protein